MLSTKVTRRHVEDLKRLWLEEHSWKLEDTVGFEEYKDELLEYRLKHEVEIEKKENEIRNQAEKLGVIGLYRILIQNEELLRRHTIAINYLINKEPRKAYKSLKGNYCAID